MIKRYYPLIFSMAVMLLATMACAKDNPFTQQHDNTTATDLTPGMGYVQLWVNYTDVDERNPVIRIGGHEITGLILTVESVCAQPEDLQQPCVDLDMSEVVDIDDTLEGVQINLLQVLDNEPVFFSKFAIPLGTYGDVELNLVPDMQFIEIDGKTYTLKLTNHSNVLKFYEEFSIEEQGSLYNLKLRKA